MTRRMVNHISIPMDLFTTVSPAAIRPAEPYLHTHPASPPKVIDGVLPILNRSQRPVILAGRGTPGYSAELTVLAEKWGAGIIHTMPATGVVPIPILWFLAVSAWRVKIRRPTPSPGPTSARWPAPPGGPETMPPAPCRYQIDFEPANIGVQTPVHYGIVGDVGQILPRLTDQLPDNPRANWRTTIEMLRGD